MDGRGKRVVRGHSVVGSGKEYWRGKVYRKYRSIGRRIGSKGDSVRGRRREHRKGKEYRKNRSVGNIGV